MRPPSSRRGPGSARACASVPFAWSAARSRSETGSSCMSHVVVAGRTTIGARTRIFPFASIGHQPQDLKYKGEPSTLEVGSDCIIREGVTHQPRHRGRRHADRRSATSCAFLANSHVGHDCRVGNNVIFSNNVMLAGHVTVGDYAILGGGAAVIQFARVGAHAFLGGMSGLENDLIPYGMALGNRAHLSGLNIIGLQRRGFSREDIHSLRRAYRAAVCRRGHAGGAPRRRREGVRGPSDRQGDRRLHPRRRQALAVRAARRGVSGLCRCMRRSVRGPSRAVSTVQDAALVTSRIGILAGGGRLPLMIAESVAARGEARAHRRHRGRGRSRPSPASRTPGSTGARSAAWWRRCAREGGDELVIAGAVTRPDLRRIRPDAGLLHEPAADRAPAGGAATIPCSRASCASSRARASRCAACTRWPPTCWRAPAAWAASRWAQADRADAELGFAVRQALGAVDAGQAVVVAHGKVLAIEGAEGTDAMLRAGGGTAPGRVRRPGAAGVLAKGPEAGPGAARRHAGHRAAHHRAGGGCRPGRGGGRGRRGAGARPGRGHRAADARGCAVHGLAAAAAARRRLRAGATIGRVIGRRRPSRRDAADIERGLAAVDVPCALRHRRRRGGGAPLRAGDRGGGGAGGHARARGSAARQWGLRWRKVGVFVRRVDGCEAGGERARGPLRPGGSAGAGRHRRDRSGPCARRPTRMRRGSPTTRACFWCCARR